MPKRIPAAADGKVRGQEVRPAAEPLSGKRDRTRRRLLLSAFKLIGHEKGLSVRIEEICADAGVSKGTFYNYFSSLEELFGSLAIDISHDFNLALVATLEGIEDNVVATNAAIQHYLKRAQRDPCWGWAMVHLSANGPLFGAESYEACFQTLDRGIKNGDFDVPNAFVGRDLLMGAVLAAMISGLRGAGPWASSRVVAHHVLRALGVPDERAKRLASQSLPDILHVGSSDAGARL